MNVIEVAIATIPRCSMQLGIYELAISTRSPIGLLSRYMGEAIRPLRVPQELKLSKQWYMLFVFTIRVELSL